MDLIPDPTAVSEPVLSDFRIMILLSQVSRLTADEH